MVKVEFSAVVSGGAYGGEELTATKVSDKLVELDGAQVSSLTPAEVEEIRDLVGQRFRQLQKETDRQMDVLADQARERERARRREEAEKDVPPPF